MFDCIAGPRSCLEASSKTRSTKGSAWGEWRCERLWNISARNRGARRCRAHTREDCGESSRGTLRASLGVSLTPAPPPSCGSEPPSRAAQTPAPVDCCFSRPAVRPTVCFSLRRRSESSAWTPESRCFACKHRNRNRFDRHRRRRCRAAVDVGLVSRAAAAALVADSSSQRWRREAKPMHARTHTHTHTPWPRARPGARSARRASETDACAALATIDRPQTKRQHCGTVAVLSLRTYSKSPSMNLRTADRPTSSVASPDASDCTSESTSAITSGRSSTYGRDGGQRRARTPYGTSRD